MKEMRVSLFAVWILVCSGLALGCEWDQSVNQTLHFSAFDKDQIRNEVVPDLKSCQKACCDWADCELVVVGTPADGPLQCQLVRCRSRGQNACDLRPPSLSGDQFLIYRKKVDEESRTETGQDDETPRLSPLMETPEQEEEEEEEKEEEEEGEERKTETNNIYCRLPMKPGPCRASFLKVYYDVTNQTCKNFTYGGCQANKNNFNTMEECEKTCSGVTGSVLPDESTPAPPQPQGKALRMVPAIRIKVSQEDEGAATAQPDVKEKSAKDFAERCEAEPEAGPCRAAFQHWYYNKETGSCQSFIYGGCRGNKNNYVSQESCMAACTVTVLPSSKKAVPEAECLVAPDPGPCRAAFTMFYFDQNSGTCQSFLYGGCRGNKNRFSSMDECMKSCSQTECVGADCGNFHRLVHGRWTAAFFLFVTLAAISALILVTLVVITLRRRGLYRRPSSVSDKEELLPDPDEQPSTESLTVPDSPKPDKA